MQTLLKNLFYEKKHLTITQFVKQNKLP